MIITKAPLRTSFAGGGTDLRAFYCSETGSVTSTAIDKFVYVALHRHFDNKILLKYSHTELVDDVNEIKNELFRECLRYMNITKGIEITSMADMPVKTGLGGSESFAVALLHALHAFKGEHVSQEQLAMEACHISIEVLKRPIGKQDQYAAAYGGLNHIEFHPDESVRVLPLVCKPEVLRKLNDSLLMFYTGITRSATDILSEQKEKTEDKRETLRKMKKLSEDVRDSLISGDLEGFAAALHNGWMEKRKVTGKISNNFVDECYENAMQAGAKGGKLLGAGGGGFLLFYCDKEKQDRLRNALQELKEVSFNLERQGSRIKYVGD